MPVNTGGGVTTVDDPAIWIYVPFKLMPDYDAQLVLKQLVPNEANPEQFDEVFINSWWQPLQEPLLSSAEVESGIYRFPLSLADIYSTEESVDPNTQETASSSIFLWQLEIFCNAMGSRPALVEGTIRVIESDLSIYDELQSGTPQARSQVYANEGVWYDALTALGNALLVDPDNVNYRTEWQQLLEDSTVGLDVISDESLFDCCTDPN